MEIRFKQFSQSLQVSRKHWRKYSAISMNKSGRFANFNIPGAFVG
jgi:hypothetical protein